MNNQATINNTSIQDCWTDNSIGETACIEGAIITDKSWLNIDGCTFTNNTSDCHIGGGGALLIQYKSIAKLRKGEFNNNRANGSGGTLLIAILSNVTIESSRFLMNSANKKGGVVYIESRMTGRECV